MMIKEVRYIRENKKFNMSYFSVTFLNKYCMEDGPHSLCIWGDTGVVTPEWCTPYREEILRHRSTRLPLIFALFEEKF